MLTYLLRSIVILFLFWNCSTRKDTVFNRAYHSLSSEYNILFNGQNYYNDVLSTLEKDINHANYWDVLNVETYILEEDETKYKDRIQLEDKNIDKAKLVLDLVTNTKKKTIKKAPQDPKENNYEKRSYFNSSEKKATKAIQKHAMKIKGRERNPQTDEAYMLLGKSRYYSGRFVPALDAFNYILYNYPGSDVSAQANIWREKANIHLNNNWVALTNLKRLFKVEKLFKQDYADAMATTGQAYLNLKHKDSALQVIKNAAVLTKNNAEKARYNFIVGQLFESFGVYDSASVYFKKTIKLKSKAPRVYYIHAALKNFSIEEANTEKKIKTQRKFIDKFERNKNNRLFLDKIYYYKAQFLKQIDSSAASEKYFKKAVSVSKDSILKVKAYEILAKNTFERKNYILTSTYYDSILNYLNPKTKAFFKYTQKRENLEDVIKYEIQVKRNDSILKIISLSEREKMVYFNKLIDSLRTSINKKKEALKSLPIKQEQEESNQSAFYFYNTTEVEQGKLYFQSHWGDIDLDVNWKYNAKTSTKNRDALKNQLSFDNIDTDALEIDKRLTVGYYLKKSTYNSSEVDSIRQELNHAYFQLGRYYKDRFKDFKTAEERFKFLISNNPSDNQLAATRYYLFRIYEKTNTSAAFYIKQTILDEHKNTIYAQMLDVDSGSTKDWISEVKTDYNTVYQKFIEKKYQQVLNQSNLFILKYNEHEIASKFVFLKALTIGRLKGFTAFNEIIENELNLLYPSSDEAMFMAQFNKTTKKRFLFSKFLNSPQKTHWKIIFPISKENGQRLMSLKEKLEQGKAELNYYYLYFSTDIFKDDTVFLVLHGFLDKEEAQGFQELIRINKNFEINDENFVISSSNYKTLQLHKNLLEYQDRLK